ncbi:RNA-binding protein [Sporobolomyces salmoneus]|uniref:RNA-binding protein n=1 Tax=Sporobolomyces salmoneus TaxID=183962 RepID=UPI00316AFA27
MSESNNKKLTKKEKKALAFRSSKGKNKTPQDLPFTEEDAVPISEDVNEAEKATTTPAAKTEGKKRKRETEEDGEDATKTGEEGENGEEVPKKKKRQRGKKKSQQIKPGGVDEEGKPRLIVFVGNLPYKVTAEEIKKHFEPCGEAPQVRILTPKPSSTSSSTPPASKGCAFVQFTTATALQSALRLHHSLLSNRKINVELTAGGGGNSEQRKQKISSQREKLEKEREKASKNKRLREGETEDGDKTGRWKLAAAKQSDGGAEGEGEEGAIVEGGRKKKVRDRRNRETKPGAGAEKAEAERKKAAERKAEKASSGANAIKLASGWGNKTTTA